MPSIVVTPKYNPFTFDELYRPLAETTKMQMALEDQYNAMEMEAAKLDYLKNSDPDAYAVVKNYENTLRGLAGELASNGLTPQSRQGVYDMRKMYSSDIEPINKYIAWKDAQAKSRQAIRDKDNTYMWETPLEKIQYNVWKDNPNMVLQGASGEALTKSVSEQVKNIAKRYQENPEGLQISDLGKEAPYLKDLIGILQEYGASRDQILGYMRKNNLTEEQQRKLLGTLQPLFDEAIDNTRKSFGIDKWSNQEDIQDWFNGSVNAGLWSAIGVDQFGMQHKPSEGNGSGTPWEVKEANHNWKWITGSKNPTFISSLEDAVMTGNVFKQGFNNVIDYMSRLSNIKTGLDYRIQNALPYDASTTGFNEFLKNELGDVNPASSTDAIRNAIKTMGFSTTVNDTGFSLDFTGEGPKKKYQEFIDNELKKKDSKVIREIEGNERDTVKKYAHKVNVPAIVALTQELDKAGSDNEKRNIILSKYASMPLDRLAEIEVVDTNPYKATYSIKDISDLLGGDNASNKISEAYTTLKDFTENRGDSDDAAAFGVHVYNGNESNLKKALIRSYADGEKVADDEAMMTYEYKWNDDKQDFERIKTDETIAYKDLAKADIADLEYSERGLFFTIMDESGHIFKVRYRPLSNRENAINKKLKEISKYTADAKEKLEKSIDEWTDSDKKAYNLLLTQIKGMYSEIDNIIAEDLRLIESTPEKR